MSAVALALVALGVLGQAPPAPTSATPSAAPAREEVVHHVLVLDDSGSMETDFDVHGFALAVPQLFHRMVGAAHPERLTVMTLAQDVPIGPVLRLGPKDYLTYRRENGTYYAKAIHEAIEVAKASRATRVEIALVTDAEPEDRFAREAIDDALAADPRLRFTCFQLGTTDPGDLCEDRTHFARDGFDMARLMASHLAASMGSIPRWGRIDKAGQAVPIPLGRFVTRMHVLAFGARAGEDFAASVVRPGAGGAGGAAAVATPLVIDHTRPMMTADELERSARTDPKSRMELPVGPSPRLALGTLSLAGSASRDVASLDASAGGGPADDAGATPELRLVRAAGPVAWGVILEYDLDVELVAPATIPADAATFTARAHLTERGAHVDDVAALAALGMKPTLVVEVAGTTTTLPMTLGGDGWASVEVPAAENDARWTLVARFTAATADLASAPADVTRANPARLDVSSTPNPTPPPPTPPSPTPPAAPATPPPPEPAPPVASTPTPAPISAWLPPTLDFPAWSFERQVFTTALTVTTAASTPAKTLTGDEIRAQGLGAALVIDGQELPMTLVGDRFEVTHTLPEGPRSVTAQIVMRYPGGEIRSAPDVMEVVPDAAVVLAPTHDFGAVASGCDLDAHCQPLDLAGSRALDRVAVTVARDDVHDDLAVTVRRGIESHALTREAPITFGPSPLPLEACFAPPGCEDVPDDLAATLTVAPADARLATPERTAKTSLVAAVVPSSWLACNLWWCLIVGGTLLFLFIVWGYVRPHAFPAGAFIQVADQERRLAKDPGRPLRSVPHGRRGFYRTATCAIDPSGFTVKRTRPHVVQLKADRGRIALMPRGAALERKQRGGWVPIDRRAEPFLLSGATYRVNQVFVFRVLA